MDDLISRQAAINALKNQMSDWNDDYNVPVKKSIEILNCLQSAQPERKTGRWKMWKWYTSSDKDAWTEEYKCSVCKFKYGEPEWNFCPNCGAKMEVDYGQADH